jgi:Tfp pilus assembly protein PilF
MKLDPGDARIRTNLGMALGAAGNREEALTLLSANQGDAVGHANLGYLLASTGQYGRARQEFQAALSMRPDLTLAQRALAQLDRKEQGVVVQPATAVASVNQPATLSEPGKLDPEVTRTSAPIVTVPLPPPPPLP